MTGCLYFLAGLYGLGVLFAGWPASAWMAGAFGVSAWLKRRPNKWTKSAVTSLEPFVWATAVLTGLQWAVTGGMAGEKVNAITDLERFIVQISLLAPRWTKLGWKEFVIITGLLALVSLVAPQAGLVSRFLRGSKFVSRVGTAMTALASFTFLGGLTYQSDLDDVYRKIQLQLRDTRIKITEQTVRLVAVKATTTAVKELSKEERSPLALLINLVGNTTSQRDAARAVTAALVEKDFASAPEFSFPEPATPPFHASVVAEVRDPFSELDREKAYLDGVTVVETEAEKGLKEILGKAVDTVPDFIKEIVGDYIGSLLHVESSLLLKEVQRYLEQVGDAYFDKVREPIVNRAAGYLKERFARMTSERVSSEVFETELEIKSASIQKALASARLAQDEAAALSSSSSDDTSKLCDKIETNAKAAESYAAFASSIRPEANSLLPGAGVDTASALKVAHSAELAVKSARLALEAARHASERALAARAAAGAAESGEGFLKRLIRVIPK